MAAGSVPGRNAVSKHLCAQNVLLSSWPGRTAVSLHLFGSAWITTLHVLPGMNSSRLISKLSPGEERSHQLPGSEQLPSTGLMVSGSTWTQRRASRSPRPGPPAPDTKEVEQREGPAGREWAPSSSSGGAGEDLTRRWEQRQNKVLGEWLFTHCFGEKHSRRREGQEVWRP